MTEEPPTYVERAEECLRRAGATPDPGRRARFLMQANALATLANTEAVHANTEAVVQMADALR